MQPQRPSGILYTCVSISNINGSSRVTISLISQLGWESVDSDLTYILIDKGTVTNECVVLVCDIEPLL